MGQISLQAPVVGQPNSTEDPKIASNFSVIQTLVNGNIDPSNLDPTGGVLSLAFRSGAANLSANAGDWIVAVPGITVTLPAPALNAVVTVTANSSVSGASPVTVAYGSAVIFGPGMGGGVASFVLGSPLASVVLQGNGTQWIVRDGQQDTGWVGLTPPAGTSLSRRIVGDTSYGVWTVTPSAVGAIVNGPFPHGLGASPTMVQTSASASGTNGSVGAAIANADHFTSTGIDLQLSSLSTFNGTTAYQVTWRAVL